MRTHGHLQLARDSAGRFVDLCGLGLSFLSPLILLIFIHSQDQSPDADPRHGLVLLFGTFTCLLACFGTFSYNVSCSAPFISAQSFPIRSQSIRLCCNVDRFQPNQRRSSLFFDQLTALTPSLTANTPAVCLWRGSVSAANSD